MSVLYGHRHYRPLFVNSYPELHRLFIQGVQQDVSCPVRGVTGPRKIRAAERPLGDPAVIKPRKRSAPMFHLVDYLRGFAAHDLDRILVSQIIGALDRIESMFFYRIVFSARRIPQRRIDAALRGYGMGP